jgi:hypothetical protein
MLSKQLRGEVVTQTGEGTTFELRFQNPDARVGSSYETKAVLDAQGEHSHR